MVTLKSIIEFHMDTYRGIQIRGVLSLDPQNMWIFFLIRLWVFLCPFLTSRLG